MPLALGKPVWLLVIETTLQLSVAVASGMVTNAAQEPESVLVITGAGQVITGACVSVTVTLNEQEAVLPLPSVTV